MEDESLSSILSNDSAPETPEPVAAVPAKVEAEPVKAAESTQVRDESGKFAKASEPAKVETPAEPQKPAEAAKPARADVAAIIDERRKRQALEQELQQLRQQQTPVAKPSVFDNEDEAIAVRVQEQVAPLREGLFYQSIEIARSKHGEGFAEAEAAFAEAAETDPNLVARLRASHNPGALIYVEGLRIKEMAEVGGDFAKYREKLTADHTAKLAEKDTRITALEAELETLKKTNADLQSLPRSLNKSASGSPSLADEDEEDLGSITRFNKSGSG